MYYLPYLFMGIIVVSVVYIAVTIVKYMRFVEMAQPKVEKLENQNNQVSQATEAERGLADEARLKIDERSTMVSKGKLNITQTEKAVREAQAWGKDLEVARQKEDFKRMKS